MGGGGIRDCPPSSPSAVGCCMRLHIPWFLYAPLPYHHQSEKPRRRIVKEWRPATFHRRTRTHRTVTKCLVSSQQLRDGEMAARRPSATWAMLHVPYRGRRSTCSNGLDMKLGRRRHIRTNQVRASAVSSRAITRHLSSQSCWTSSSVLTSAATNATYLKLT